MPVFASEEEKLGSSFLRENITILIVTESLKIFDSFCQKLFYFPIQEEYIIVCEMQTSDGFRNVWVGIS
jgi:hypothetical protein